MATMVPGSSADTTASAYAPTKRSLAARTADSRSGAPSRSACSIRCGTTSVSVSLVKACPAACSSSRRSAKFSMMPLCTTAMRPSQLVCGWALASLGRPWVAQRV